MQAFLRRIIIILTSGYIVMYFGELVFWANIDPSSGIGEWILTWLFYSYLVAVFLLVVSFFKVRGFWPLFLAGAFFGWLEEGVYAMTLFGVSEAPFPLTISWTALAWHAPIDILFGWYFLRKTLLQHSYRKTALIAAAFGLLYGAWAIFWWLQEVPNTVPQFALYTLITTALLLFSCMIYQKFLPSTFRYSKVETGILVAVPILSFIFLTMQFIGVFSLVLLPLFLLVLFPLLKNRSRETQPDLIVALQGSIRPVNALLFLLGPLIAIAIYATAASLSLRVPTYHLFYFPSIILGFVLLIMGIWKTLRPVVPGQN